MLPLVAKPFIEIAEKSLRRPFPFRTAIGRRREDGVEITGLRVESIKQSLANMFEGATLPVSLLMLPLIVCRSEVAWVIEYLLVMHAALLFLK